MKVNKEKVAQNRAALVSAASRLLKEKGFDGAGVMEISAAAGLTQGAFYGQFANKSALAAEACRHDLESGRAAWESTRGQTNNDALAYVAQYLNREHIDDLAGGCAMATYSGEIVRQAPEVAEAFKDGAMEMVRLLEDALRKNWPAATARRKAIFLMSSLAGTVAVVRAVGKSDPQLADEMLKAAFKEAAKLTEPPETRPTLRRRARDGEARVVRKRTAS